MSNITNLRRAGNLAAAFDLAKKNLDEKPDDLWCKRDMAWVLYDFAKQKLAVETKEQFIKCIDKITELDMPQDEDIFYQSVGFLARGIAASMIRANRQDEAFFNILFARIKTLKIKKKTPAYSSIMTVMLRTHGWWRGFKDFCDWWGFDGFMDVDYQSTQPSDGSDKKIMPLAERVVMAYCKSLLNNGLNNEIENFIPWLDSFSFQHKNYIYLPFYGAKLLWKIGKKDDYYAKMKIFARKKSGEFWVWDLLGDYYDDKQMRLKFYAKGLTCKSKAEMSIKLREKTAWLLLDLGYKKEALSELLFVKKIREKNKWNITTDLMSAIKEIENQGVYPEKNNFEFFQQLSSDVENIVFGTQLKKKNTNQQTVDFEGKIKISEGGFGFVRFDGKTIFVPAKLISDSQVLDNSIVKGKFTESFDKKKNKQGFMAVKLNN